MKRFILSIVSASAQAVLYVPVAVFSILAVLAPPRSPQCAYAFSQISHLNKAIETIQAMLQA